MRRAALIVSIFVFCFSASTSSAIRVRKVEIKLAEITGDEAALYSDDSVESDKEYHLNGETFIVTEYESLQSGNWYRFDTDYRYPYFTYILPDENVNIRDLGGVVTVSSNVRELPTTSADIVETVSAGDIVTVISRTEEEELVEGFPLYEYWYEIRTSSGAEGWIFGALLGLLQPREAVLYAIDELEEGNSAAALIAINETYKRFPNGRFDYFSRSFDEGYFDLAPSAELLLGYAYFLEGETDIARSHYENALSYGEKPAITTSKILDPETDHSYFMKCDYYADTLARVGLGLSWVRSDPDKAANYFARAISDAESGFSTANIVPEYFDAYLTRNLVAMHGSGKISKECLDILADKLPDECSYDFSPGYFLLYYGESLYRSGDSSASVSMFKNVVEKYSGAYLYEQGGYYSGYIYMDIAARALWNLKNIQTRLNQTDSFVSYCDKIAKSNEDKKIGFFAHYLAGIALDDVGETAMASKEYSRAQRYYEVCGFENSEFTWFYKDLYRYLERRIDKVSDIRGEKSYFMGITSDA